MFLVEVFVEDLIKVFVEFHQKVKVLNEDLNEVFNEDLFYGTALCSEVIRKMRRMPNRTYILTSRVYFILAQKES